MKALGLMPDLDDDGEAAMFRQVEQFTADQKAQYIALLAAEYGWGMKQFGQEVGGETMNALFNAAPKGEKTRQKALCNKIVTEANQSLKTTLAAIEEAIVAGQADSISEIFAELELVEHEFVMAGLTEVQKTQIADLSQEQ